MVGLRFQAAAQGLRRQCGAAGGYDLVARRRAPAAASNATATAGSAGTAIFTSTSNMTDATGVAAGCPSGRASTVTAAVPASAPGVNTTPGPTSVVDTETTPGAVDDTENVVPAYVTADATDDGNVNNASNGTVTDEPPVRRPSPSVPAAMASFTAACTTSRAFGVSAAHTERPDCVANGDAKSKSGARQSPVVVSIRNRLRLVRFPISTGIVPLNWLPPSVRLLRLVRFPISTGIVPLNWLPPRNRAVRLVRFPISTGIVPLNWLPPRNRAVRLGSFAGGGEILR